MSKIHSKKTLKNGNTLMAIEVSSSGGNRNYWPMILKVVELTGDEYTRSNAKNVAEIHAEIPFNGKLSTGPRSDYARKLERALEIFNEIN